MTIPIVNLETSTVNVLLGGILAANAWMLKEIISLKKSIAIIAALCPRCRKSVEPEEL